MTKTQRFFYLLILTILFFNFYPITAPAQESIRWDEPFRENYGENKFRFRFNCSSCSTDPETGLPVYTLLLPGGFTGIPEVTITQGIYQPLSDAELTALKQTGIRLTSTSIEAEADLVFDRGEALLLIRFVPLRLNDSTGLPEKLVSFVPVTGTVRETSRAVQHSYAPSSVLAYGLWYRMSFDRDGIVKLSYNDLVTMGVIQGSVSSGSIRVHGYGGGMLPERVALPRHDDLPEIPLFVSDGGDGKLDPGDHILFFVKGPMAWSLNTATGIFEHRKHLYSDYSWYFITAAGGQGKRIEEFPQPQSSPASVVTSYNWYSAHHPDEYNLIKSGKEWFGDIFDIITSRDYTFGPLEAENTSPLVMRFSAAARSTAASSFSVTHQGSLFNLQVPPIVDVFNTNYARMAGDTWSFNHNGTISGVNVKFNKPLSTATGWLNYIELNTVARLIYSGGQLGFRKTGLEGIAEYRIQGNGQPEMLWDVTDPMNPGLIRFGQQQGYFWFRALTDTLRQYMLSDAQSYLSPVSAEHVENQNLHAMAPADMLIVVHPLFMDEAIRLAGFHSQVNDLSVQLVQPQAIYNEFSSGAQDISAIRDFVRMLWIKSGEARLPRFMLMFGDASYDYKDRIPGNNNFVPTFQSVESLNPVNSYAADDFFGCIDDNEGGMSTDILDIGIGRLVVSTPEQARTSVDKIIHYTTATDKVHGDWRNVIAFVADDEDANEHMIQADKLAAMIDTIYPAYNTDKIFLDAYPQISTPGGQRAPEATAAINDRVGKGALIVNYTGHGGETGWTHERILEIADVNSWTNYDRMPVFMTATCEFSRYDDPQRLSGGELTFLNPKGGGIALFTTARPTYGNPNFILATNFYTIALQTGPEGRPFLGDLIRVSKRVSGSDINIKKFVLLGDPALKMAYPEYNVITTEINGRSVTGISDTLSALGEVTISGIVAGHDRELLAGFNGILTVTVFDKESPVSTFGSDGSSPMTFMIRKNIIYKGNVAVNGGKFSFSFIVPRDIGYQFGPGKISYYATDGNMDASGYHSDIVVGGVSDVQISDNEGPEIRLFMNDTSFRQGGFTDEKPVLIALLSDFSGINTVGNGIGHDIVAILDGKTDAPYILNDYYQADLNTYKHGKVMFAMPKLEPGSHILKMKVWDVNNNSSESSLHFVVAGSGELVLGDFQAYPNPMSDYTRFEIEHNRAGEELELLLQIFSLQGSKVAELKRTIFAGGYRTPAFEWDGRGSGGRLLTSGLYIGNLTVKSVTGQRAAKALKIAITR